MSMNYDSEALRRILRDLTSEDPEFVSSFEAEALPPSARDQHPYSYTSLVWIAVFVSASILALMVLALGSLGSALVLAGVAWFAASRDFHSTGNERNHRSEWS